MVPVAGLEPARCRQRWILSPLRLPIPSHRQVRLVLYAIERKIASLFLEKYEIIPKNFWIMRLLFSIFCDMIRYICVQIGTKKG